MEKITPYRLNLLHPVMYYEKPPIPESLVVTYQRVVPATSVARENGLQGDGERQLLNITEDYADYQFVDIQITTDPTREINRVNIVSDNEDKDYIGILVNNSTEIFTNVNTEQLTIYYFVNCYPNSFTENINLTFTLIFHN